MRYCNYQIGMLLGMLGCNQWKRLLIWGCKRSINIINCSQLLNKAALVYKPRRVRNIYLLLVDWKAMIFEAYSKSSGVQQEISCDMWVPHWWWWWIRLDYTPYSPIAKKHEIEMTRKCVSQFHARSLTSFEDFFSMVCTAISCTRTLHKLQAM